MPPKKIRNRRKKRIRDMQRQSRKWNKKHRNSNLSRSVEQYRPSALVLFMRKHPLIRPVFTLILLIAIPAILMLIGFLLMETHIVLGFATMIMGSASYYKMSVIHHRSTMLYKLYKRRTD